MKYNFGDAIIHPHEGGGTIIDIDPNTINDLHVQFADKKIWICSGSLPDTPPADDKEYREFVEEFCNELESQIKNVFIPLDGYESQDVKKHIAHLTRLIADIKKGMEKTQGGGHE